MRARAASLAEVARRFVLVAAALLAPSAARAEPAPVPTNSNPAAIAAALVVRARAEKLADEPGWRRLLHVRWDISGTASQADGRHFFLSPRGKKDPEAELEETIRGFFAVDPPGADPNDHAICRFPARFLWLSERLGLRRGDVPAHECPKLADYWKKTQLRGVTLVFSSYYLNNPSSAFGHTFMRFDKAPPNASSERRELLDYGIDYSATVPNVNPLFYAVGGIAGFFPGNFRMIPYYYKVREYNDFESRDLWEYDLDLSPEEVRMAAAHVWELGQTAFDYFYLTENCSYHMLGILEAASPRLDLIDKVKWPVIPVDTIKALTETPGLVKAVHYRPSLRSVFEWRIRDLDATEKDAVEALVRDPETALPAGETPERQAKVLDAAADYVDMRFAKLISGDADTPAARLKQRLLERRAELGVTSDDVTLTPTPDQYPHESHDSQRAALGVGASNQHRGFLSARYRLAIHDLADPTTGYPVHSAIEFFPTELRFSLPDHTVRFEDTSFVKITSLNPMNRFELRPSWKIRFGATTVRDAGCRECVFGVLEGGTGPAIGDRFTVFATGDGALYGPRFAGSGTAKARAGLGPSVGFRARFTPELVWLTEAQTRWFPAQHQTFSSRATTTLRWGYAKDWALDVAGALTTVEREATVSTMLYF